jgi:hypothetical protein
MAVRLEHSTRCAFYGTNFPFDVSRDGRHLVVTNSQHLSDEIWLLEAAQKP